ncbi:MAG: hypothetical protein KKA79_08065, partial [Nanoarchaeota archaeon]|nr:hypothetical protein [Nanoarchaeota archaeon]
NTIPKISFYIPKSNFRMPIISASKLDYTENIIEKMMLKNQNLNLNDLEIIREISLAERNKEDQVKKIIPGYQ